MHSSSYIRCIAIVTLSFLMATALAKEATPITTSKDMKYKRQRITTRRATTTTSNRDRDLHALVNPFLPTAAPVTASTKIPTASTKSPTRAPNVVGSVNTSSASQMMYSGSGAWISSIVLAVGAGALLSFGI